MYWTYLGAVQALIFGHYRFDLTVPHPNYDANLPQGQHKQLSKDDYELVSSHPSSHVKKIYLEQYGSDFPVNQTSKLTNCRRDRYRPAS